MSVARRILASFCFLVLAGCTDDYFDPPPAVAPHDPNDPRGVWLAIRPTQCSMSDPWRADWSADHAGQKYPSESDLSLLLKFCAKQGVIVHDSTMQSDPIGACAACTCGASHLLFLLVDPADVDDVAAMGGRPRKPVGQPDGP